MRPLNINLDELANVMESAGQFEHQGILDTKTGEILSIANEFIETEDEIDDEEESLDDLPDWQREEREQARLVLNDTEGRFQEIPPIDGHDAYRLMEEFIGSVHDERAKDLLSRAIDDKGAFRRFKDTLIEFPVLRQQWFDFEASRKRNAAEEWLESLDIQSTWVPTPPT
jgi:hypothetical protein